MDAAEPVYTGKPSKTGGYPNQRADLEKILTELGFVLRKNRAANSRLLALGTDEYQLRFVCERSEKYLQADQPCIVVRYSQADDQGEPEDDLWSASVDDDLESAVMQALLPQPSAGGPLRKMHRGRVADDRIAEFRAQSIGLWWQQMGHDAPRARNLLVLTDRQMIENGRWKDGLVRFANATGLGVEVVEFPLVTHEWSTMQHTMESQALLSRNGNESISVLKASPSDWIRINEEQRQGRAGLQRVFRTKAAGRQE